MEENKSNLPEKPVTEKIKINKYLRNFFFNGFKARAEFKGLEKAIGKIDTVNLIMAKDKNVLRAINLVGKKQDSPMTNEEIQKFLRGLGVKQKTIDESKSIIVQLDMNTQICYIQQTRIDGNKKFFEI